jgi:hypothetical protein
VKAHGLQWALIVPNVEGDDVFVGAYEFPYHVAIVQGEVVLGGPHIGHRLQAKEQRKLD